MSARRDIDVIRCNPTRPQVLDYHLAKMSLGQFATSLVLGFLSILLPLLVFIAMVATCVYVARWWMDRKS